jgi:DNA mismatch repair protein MutS
METPLMRQYNQIKAKHPDTILLFRLGDFFETFGDDAVATAAACGITLTKRNNGAAGDIPLAGFPHHQIDNYLPKLVHAGYKVAVCEQLEDPKHARGIVRRDVVEVVTPGVVLYDKLLDSRSNTFLLALHAEVEPKSSKTTFGVAVIDVSTGTFIAGSVSSKKIASVIESFSPAEIIVNKQMKQVWEPLSQKLPVKPVITRIDEWHFDVEYARTALLRQFQTSSLKGFGFESDDDAGIVAAGAALHYVSQTQQGALRQLTGLRVLHSESIMVLDTATRRNLEIHSSMRDSSSAGALIGVLDRTATPMGGRMLRWWLQTPQISLHAINDRLSAVRGFAGEPAALSSLRTVLQTVGDVERLLTRVVTDRAHPREMSALRLGLATFGAIRNILTDFESNEVRALATAISMHDEVLSMLKTALVDEPAIQPGHGKIFKHGYHVELDEVCTALTEGKRWIAEYQDRERTDTGIASLKVGYTSVFGYYIEVSKTHSGRVPDYFERKQTLANAERYTTARLRELEHTLLNAEGRVTSLETELFAELRKNIAAHCAEIQRSASALAQVDCLSTFAQNAIDYEYTEPVITEGDELRIEGARHPVIEQRLPVGTPYIANSVILDTSASQIAIITGPNMSGKSSYLRQTGLIVFLAHVGSFVPATAALIPLTDRIFTRVGAQDNITAGESTFLVEMQESANILNNATKQSLILLDEVGRGTATFDGISIAWAIAEYVHEVVGAKTLFATHYHELTSLAGSFDRIINLCVEVKEVGDDIVFTHRVVPGFTDHSFGIHVARMAGMPPSVITTSTAILHQLEGNDEQSFRAGRTASVERHSLERTGQLTMFTVQDDELRRRMKDLDIDNMTPLQALQALVEMKESIDHEP